MANIFDQFDALDSDSAPRDGPLKITVTPKREPRGIRNNNPGNIEDGDFARAQPGYKGSDGRFAVFESPDSGMAAMDSLLSSYGRRGIDTPAGIVNRWAPASDGNPVSAYASFVANGSDPLGKIDMNDPVVRRGVAERMVQFENGKPVRVARAQGTPQPNKAANPFDQFDSPPEPQAPQSRDEFGPPVPRIGQGEAMARGAARGMTANFYDELRGLMEAGGLSPNEPASLSSLAMGAYRTATGDEEARKRYESARSRERGLDTMAADQNPGSAIMGELAGAVALPVGGLLRGATLPARIGRSAAVGAGYGAAAGAGEGEGAEDRLARAATGGAAGAAVGAVAPPIVEGALQAGRAIVRPVSSAVRGALSPETEAARRVASALQRDLQADPNSVSRLTPQEFTASAQGGGPAGIIDMGGDTTRALARSAANTSPEGRGSLERMINDRFAGQGGRVTGWLEQTFHYPNAEAQQRAISEAARTANRAAYARAYRDGAIPLWDEGFQQLTAAPVVRDAVRAATKTGANKAAAEGFRPPQNPFDFAPDGTMVAREGVTPTLQFWDNVKRNLDDRISSLMRSGEKSAAADAMALKNALVSHLDELVPSYRQARAGASQFFGAENALEAGQNFVTANLGLNETRRALSAMSPQERQLFQDGFVSRFIEIIDRTGDRRNIINQITGSSAARQKLNIALGPQRAQELEAVMRVEGIMDLARGAVSGNSTTIRQRIEQGLAGGSGAIGAYGIYNLDPTQMTMAALGGALLAGRRGIDQRLARRVAEMLTSNDPTVMMRGIRAVARNNRLMDNLRSVDRRLSVIGAEQAPSPGLQSIAPSRAEDN